MPSLRKSRHFFSLPCQCIRSKTLPQRIVTVHHFSFANHISAFLCHSFALPFPRRSTMPSLRYSPLFLCLACLCFSVPLHSSSPHSLRKASPCLTLPCRCRAKRRLCASSQITAMPLQCKSLLRCAKPSHGQSNSALPLPSGSLLCDASANQGRQCHALALRPSPHKRCR